MKSKRSTQLTRQIGEHLVASKLGRMGYIAAPFAGNVALFDLVAADEYGESIPIQVKAINERSSWQYQADTLLEIKQHGNTQKCAGKKRLLSPKLVCVYVALHSENPDEFYIFHLSDLQEFTLKHYFQNGRSRIRPKNPTTTHCAIYPKHLKEFKDNWELIHKSFKKNPKAVDAKFV